MLSKEVYRSYSSIISSFRFRGMRGSGVDIKLGTWMTLQLRYKKPYIMLIDRSLPPTCGPKLSIYEGIVSNKVRLRLQVNFQASDLAGPSPHLGLPKDTCTPFRAHFTINSFGGIFANVRAATIALRTLI